MKGKRLYTYIEFVVLSVFSLFILMGCGMDESTSSFFSANEESTKEEVADLVDNQEGLPMDESTSSFFSTNEESTEAEVADLVDNQEALPIGSLILKAPNAKTVYHWFLYIPRNLNKNAINYILITGVNANILSNDYKKHINETRKITEGRRGYADQYNYILLAPVIPRHENGAIYTCAFSRNTLLDRTDFYQRADLKVNNIIDEFQKLLKKDGYNVASKVFIQGFSAGAMFAQRYSLLQPLRVKAIAAGQCGGSLTLASKTYKGVNMDWPVGINDFESLLGYNFNLTAYKKIPQFIYIGDEDNTHSTVEPGKGDLFSAEQMSFLINNFGSNDPIRISNQSLYLQKLGCGVSFKMYKGVGHRLTNAMLNDSFKFFNKYR